MKFGSIRRFLRRFERNHSAAMEENEPVRESITDAGYYEEISIRYASVQLVGMMMLAVVLAVSLLVDSSLLSADNLAVFAKDMTSSVAIYESAARDTMVYTADEDNRYVMFREGPAVLGSNKLTVFTATGREAYSDYFSYATPRLLSSGRYLVAYDLGGTSYRLYNSFSCVKRGTTDSPIRAVAAANNGYYAVVTDGENYASLVTLYNERFRVVNRYYMKEYTACADLSENGERLLLASVSSQGGRMTTHILLAEPGKGEALSEWTVEDAYPVAAQLTESGNVLLLSTDFVAWFDENGQELSRYTFISDQVRSYQTGAFGCVLVCRANAYDASVCVLAFDKNGREVYNITTDVRVKDVSYYGGVLGVLTDEGLLVYCDGESESAFHTELIGDYTVLMAYAENEFILCGDGKAIVVRAILK